MDVNTLPCTSVLTGILAQAEKRPDALALWTEGGSFTYAELTDYAKGAAAALQREGLQPGDVITIELPRTREYVGMCLAAWMCGAAFAASDTAYPQARRDYIAENCDARLRINAAFLEACEIIPGEQPVMHEPLLDDRAFFIYTSGSTGKPKGVIHTHLGLAVSTVRSAKFAALQPEDHWASPAAFSFITGLQPIFTAFEYGASCYIVPDAARKDLGLLADFLAEHEITIMFLPPAMTPYFKQKKPTLRALLTGSERVANVYSDEYRLINCWGLTEMCNVVLAFEIDKPYKNTPLGFPVGDERIYILDENGNEVEEGEICCAGHLAIGYHKLEEETARVFRPNPFKDVDGYDIIIHSGDRGRRLADGSIEFLERIDWMVSINGQRVEPGEIAATINSMPQVLRCAVVDFEKPDGQVSLAAFYQPVAPVTEEQIREFVAANLPAYMMPEHFMMMQQMPVNINGKIDRSALPNPFEAAGATCADASSATNFPDDPLVNQIREILERCSGRNDFGYEDDLTEKGLSSLTAIQFCSIIDEEMGVTIPIAGLIGGCSIRSIEEMIRKEKA